MSFDFRVFSGQSFDGTSQSVDGLLYLMDESGIESALVCPFKPLSYDLAAANEALASSISGHADRLVGAARVDPWQSSALNALRQATESLGLCALYLNPWEEHFRADLGVEIAGRL
ncbi:MAG: hypothetical protein ACWGO1_13980, partial [Anaerolineales bacterium]